jgi:hypothetical protein
MNHAKYSDAALALKNALRAHGHKSNRVYWTQTVTHELTYAYSLMPPGYLKDALLDYIEYDVIVFDGGEVYTRTVKYSIAATYLEAALEIYSTGYKNKFTFGLALIQLAKAEAHFPDGCLGECLVSYTRSTFLNELRKLKT